MVPGEIHPALKPVENAYADAMLAGNDARRRKLVQAAGLRSYSDGELLESYLRQINRIASPDG